jgi:uncharacterized protein with HEPN domain
MRKNDIVYLEHIKGAIESIKSYLGDVDYAGFMENRMMIDAVMKQLEIIGEAANNISKDFVDAHPYFPWKDMIATRNFLIHEYFGINSETIWGTCKNDLPKLEEAIDKTLAS